jgi:4-diphosphocytidyl-2-C-methyl-D-erythritol kinase
LRVLAREQSGFHSIETIFHRIELADDILVAVADGKRTLDVAGADAGPVEKNLAYRAAIAFADRTGWPRGFHIELTKRIPVGAGLGGGSADASAVLDALNFLSPKPLPASDLLELAAPLGADASFLASDALMALAWGHGERMLALAPLPATDIVLLTPGFSVVTADAYRWLDEDLAADRQSRETSARDAITLRPESLTTWRGISAIAQNDFEPVIATRHPEITRYLEELRQLDPVMAMMTGSGSTLFGVYERGVDLSRMSEELRARATTTKTSTGVVRPVRVG